MNFKNILNKLDTINGNKKKPLTEAVTLTADGAEGMALVGMLRLAGLEAPQVAQAPIVTPPAMPIPSMPTTPELDVNADDLTDDNLDMSFDDEVEIVPEDDETMYSNTPNERISDIDAILMTGDDMHKPRGSYQQAAGGDNPQNIKVDIGESDILDPNEDFDLEEDDCEDNVDVSKKMLEAFIGSKKSK